MSWRPLLIAGVALAVARPAYAQRAEADAAFQRGRALLASGQTAEACAEFETSMRLDPANGTLYNLGLCHEKLGKLATAWSELRELAANDTNRPRAQDAARRVAELEPRLTRMRLVADGAPPGLIVRRDDLDVTVFIGQSPPVDPARYRFEATAPGHVTATFELELAAEGQTVDVVIPALEPEATSTPTPTGYPAELALRPLILPARQLELSAHGTIGTSSSFDQPAIDLAASARYSLGVIELEVGAAMHALYANDLERPDLWSQFQLGVRYAIQPRLLAGITYVRHHPTQGAGNGATGSDLQAFGARKLLLTPRIAVVGRGGLVFSEREGRKELSIATEGRVQAIGTSRVALEAIAFFGLNTVGSLIDHTADFALTGRVLVAMGTYDLFVAASTRLLPDANYQAGLIGASWRLR